MNLWDNHFSNSLCDIKIDIKISNLIFVADFDHSLFFDSEESLLETSLYDSL